jgi:hypothetical protein
MSEYLITTGTIVARERRKRAAAPEWRWWLIGVGAAAAASLAVWAVRRGKKQKNHTV